jgi:hypothetical protein
MMNQAIDSQDDEDDLHSIEDSFDEKKFYLRFKESLMAVDKQSRNTNFGVKITSGNTSGNNSRNVPFNLMHSQ